MTYYSKIDVWLILVVGIALLVPAVLGIKALLAGDPSAYTSLGSFVAILILFVLVLPCKYTLTQSEIEIKAGVLINQKVSYSDIISIEKSSNILSAPALSLKRIKITTKTGMFLISPPDRDEFIRKVNKKIKSLRS
ncbi:MAG: PH domain-containing protein [bacterium]